VSSSLNYQSKPPAKAPLPEPLLLALQTLAAFIGGIVGVFVSAWLLRQGFYAMVLPGGLAGIAAGIFRTRLVLSHALCGIWALVIGTLAEWHLRPFIADPSLTYFLSHLGNLMPITWIMIAAGAFLGFFIPFSRRAEERQSA